MIAWNDTARVWTSSVVVVVFSEQWREAWTHGLYLWSRKLWNCRRIQYLCCSQANLWFYFSLSFFFCCLIANLWFYFSFLSYFCCLIANVIALPGCNEFEVTKKKKNVWSVELEKKFISFLAEKTFTWRRNWQIILWINGVGREVTRQADSRRFYFILNQHPKIYLKK